MRDQEQEVLGRAEAGPGGVAPSDPELLSAERLFSAGDFRSAGALAKAALRSESEEVRLGARDLLDRIRPDPAALWMALGCLVLLASVVYLTLSHVGR